MVTITRRKDGAFDVNLDGAIVTVPTEDVASQIATLPVVHAAFKEGHRNKTRIAKMVQVCNECGYNPPCKRELENWLSK